MSYILKTNYALRSNYGSYRNTSAIKYIVIHYTANDGDTDESNARYFKRAYRGASAHYFVDDDSATISVPDTYVAWSVGGKRYSNYKSTGGAKYYKKCTNSNSLNIEMCDSLRNGVIMATEATIQNTVDLVKSLMNKYNIPIENVIRHFDVTGKSCPAYFVNNSKWNEFKNRIKSTNTPTQPVFDQKAVNKEVQKWINTYLGANIAVDGVIGNNSKAYLNKCLQKALNVYQTGNITASNLNLIKYSNVKASLILTKIMESYLFVRGYNPQDYNGNYNSNVRLVVRQFQSDMHIGVDGCAGKGTFGKLVF